MPEVRVGPIHTFAARRIFKCKDCQGQCSVTSGTIFASRKMAIRDILAAIAIFTYEAKGHSGLQLNRDLDCPYKEASVVAPRSEKRSRRDAVIHADEASAWDALYATFSTKRSTTAKPIRGTALARTKPRASSQGCAALRSGFTIAGPYLNAYAAEMSWRKDNRRVSNGEQFLATAGAALAHPVSRVWKGYWQRAAA